MIRLTLIISLLFSSLHLQAAQLTNDQMTVRNVFYDFNGQYFSHDALEIFFRPGSETLENDGSHLVAQADIKIVSLISREELVDQVYLRLLDGIDLASLPDLFKGIEVKNISDDEAKTLAIREVAERIVDVSFGSEFDAGHSVIRNAARIKFTHNEDGYNFID